MPTTRTRPARSKGFNPNRNRDHVTKEVTLDFEDEGELNLTMIPSRFTVGLQRRIQDAANANDMPLMADLFFTIVKDWDMVDENGEVMPLSQDSIDTLSLDTFLNILQKLGESISPKEETSTS